MFVFFICTLESLILHFGSGKGYIGCTHPALDAHLGMQFFRTCLVEFFLTQKQILVILRQSRTTNSLSNVFVILLVVRLENGTAMNCMPDVFLGDLARSSFYLASR